MHFFREWDAKAQILTSFFSLISAFIEKIFICQKCKKLLQRSKKNFCKNVCIKEIQNFMLIFSRSEQIIQIKCTWKKLRYSKWVSFRNVFFRLLSFRCIFIETSFRSEMSIIFFLRLICLKKEKKFAPRRDCVFEEETRLRVFDLKIRNPQYNDRKCGKMYKVFWSFDPTPNKKNDCKKNVIQVTAP
jgi:hypothetical protein